MSAFVYDGRIAFNSEWVASKTFKEFQEHEKHHGLSEKEMKEIHAACVKMAGKKAPEKSGND